MGKMTQQQQYLFHLLGVVLFCFGCAKSPSTDTTNAVVPVPLPTQAPYVTSDIPGAPGSTQSVYSGTTYSSGATTAFNIVSSDEFNLFVASHPVDPQNVVINIDLKEVPTRGTYAGTVKIHYTSNGQSFEASLNSGTKSWDGQDYFMYNYFFNYQNKQVFSGFFDDTYGAIVLIFNNTVDLGDGAGPSQFSGEVWYKNYVKSFATYDAGAGWSVVLPCWFRTIGPYDCRSSAVINKTDLYPSADGYRKLGSFSNLNRVKAINIAQ